ncbi:hypothetical protein FE257_000426 [Aspergillus nanangensis]|uniref:Phosphoinositide phospholipase C n=1 Tax=Aspergillus nanangensis TaxID=2582783 RepID=A0AAD4CUS5_ASPNN|nr:hypothetical protein FE257_000426 [Aspergillus nanangensis]
MEKLVNKTRHLSMSGSDSSKKATPEATPQATPFAPAVLSHLEKIHNSLTAANTDFVRSVQHESPQPVGDSASVDPLASLAAFQAYMASPASSALSPAKQPDYSAPMTDYFISSSHNTYLTGNQLSSDSDASTYAAVSFAPYRPCIHHCRKQSRASNCTVQIAFPMVLTWFFWIGSSSKRSRHVLSLCVTLCVEIDVWDGDDSDDESSSSSSDDETIPSSQKGNKPKTELSRKKPGKKARLGSKLGSLLGRSKSSAGRRAPPPTIKEPVDAAVLPRPEPKVLHGHTLTKGTTFRDVCYTIRDNAFVANDMPVIVSLEVHASIEQQQTMVEIMEEAFKGMLLEVTPEIEASQIPPPETLKRKILIKVKWVSPAGQGDDEGDRTDEVDELKKKASQSEPTNNTTTSTTPTPSKQEQQQPPPPPPSKIFLGLSKLAVFTKGYRFSHFAQPEAKVPGHVFSLSEKAARAAYAKDPAALFEHNRGHFMRIYPFGLRVNSSNLDPSFFWRRGAQIVALNWQSVDKGMMLNHAMFADKRGWVLKPQGYRSADAASVPITRRQLDLCIEILAGQNIPLPPGDTNEKGFKPYVACYLHVETPVDDTTGAPQNDDASSDSEKSSYKRTIKSATGRNPDFGNQSIQFPTLSGVIDELTFVRFKVKDDEFARDSLAAWACIKLDRLQEGYRLIHLTDCSGSDCAGALLVRVTKKLS